MKVILFEPQIPQNTGNVVRTCKVVGASLLLVRPLGFSVSDKALKRAGLDYWDGVGVEIIDDLYTYLETLEHPFYFFSSKAKKSYTEVAYSNDAHLIFGSETKGLNPIFFERWPQHFITLPQKPHTRCLNLSNAVAVGLYEAWRQNSFL
jgi:tRNA (cytidine/uridine-2'-O-)-methyltransferase